MVHFSVLFCWKYACFSAIGFFVRASNQCGDRVSPFGISDDCDGDGGVLFSSLESLSRGDSLRDLNRV